MAILLSFSPHPPNPHHNRKCSVSNTPNSSSFTSTLPNTVPKRHFTFKTATLGVISITSQNPLAQSLAESSSSSKLVVSGIANTKSWFQFYGDGFAIRVPQFEDIMEPEDYNAGLSLYGDKAKPKIFGGTSLVICLTLLIPILFGYGILLKLILW